VRVVCGAPLAEPLRLVREFVEGPLELGENDCDH